MSGRNTTARRDTTPARWLRILGPIAIAMLAGSAGAVAQTADCAALRARIDGFAQGAGASQAEFAISQNRAELERVRAYAQDSGCNGGSLFDDADSPECHALLRRAEQLRQTIDRLAAQAPHADDDERRAAIENYNASCTGGGADAALPTPDTLVPVDPDAPAGVAPLPPPVDRVARVFCVRHCDGAYYPLAVDVPKDKLEGMDQLCRAQCPGAESSAYSDADDDVAKAQAADGTSYGALPAAFRFQKDISPTCSCRAAGESWGQTLAKAETMIEAHKGDVVVTPEIQARMETPLPPPAAQPGAAAKAKAARAAAKRAKTLPLKPPPPAVDAQTANPGEDLTRELRRSVPTL